MVWPARSFRREDPTLQLQTVRIGPHSEAALGRLVSGGFHLLRDGIAVIALCQCAVMTNTRWPVSRRADRDVPDLPVRRQIAQQNEVPDATLKRLLVQLRSEHLHIKPRAPCRVR